MLIREEAGGRGRATAAAAALPRRGRGRVGVWQRRRERAVHGVVRHVVDLGVDVVVVVAGPGRRYGIYIHNHNQACTVYVDIGYLARRLFFVEMYKGHGKGFFQFVNIKLVYFAAGRK